MLPLLLLLLLPVLPMELRIKLSQGGIKRGLELELDLEPSLSQRLSLRTRASACERVSLQQHALCLSL